MAISLKNKSACSDLNEIITQRGIFTKAHVREKTLLHHNFLFYFENREEGEYSLFYGIEVIVSLSACSGQLAVVMDKLNLGNVVECNPIFTSSESSRISYVSLKLWGFVQIMCILNILKDTK